MKNILIFMMIFAIGICSADAASTNSRTNAKTCTQPKVSQTYTNFYNQRASVYNTLNLSEAQVKTKDELEKQRYKSLGEKYIELDQEEYVLRQMRAGNSSKNAILRQETCVRNIADDIEKINKKYDKEFIKSLSNEQRSKYHNIKRLQNRELKEEISNVKRKYLQDKKLRTFGEK
ncbi:hypothetical protein J6E39_02055 [bacterium]|nr:hypothetical protein [bacterium]